MREKLKPFLMSWLSALLVGLGISLCACASLGLTSFWPMQLAGLLAGSAAVGVLRWCFYRRKGLFGAAMLLLIGAYAAAVFSMEPLRSGFMAAVWAVTSRGAAVYLYPGVIALLSGITSALLGWLLIMMKPWFMMLCVMELSFLWWMSGCGVCLPWLLPTAAGCLIRCTEDTENVSSLWRRAAMAMLAVLLAFIMIPQGGYVNEELYQWGQTIKKRIENHFFFTEGQRDLFSLATEGYYRQGEEQMGGPAVPNDHAVMMVKTDRKLYLGGAVKNTYTGRSWLQTAQQHRFLYISPTSTAARTEAFDLNRPAEALRESALLLPERVSVTMLRDSQSNFFVPHRLQSMGTGGDLAAYFNEAGEVFSPRSLREGDTYTLTAAMPIGGTPGLEELVNAAAARDADPNEAAVQLNYTAIPTHLQTKTRQLAAQAAGSGTPYSKALNLKNYISTHAVYRLDIPEQDTNRDFVESFLERGTGYCQHFASAMALLGRMAGLPTRYVEGYVAIPNAEGAAYVTGMNAHAWCEVYFAGFGWVVFDATPGMSGSGEQQQRTNDQQPDATPSPSPTPTPTPTPTPEPADDTEGTQQDDEAEPPEEPQATPTPIPPEDREEDEPEPEPQSNTVGSHRFLWVLLLFLLLLIAFTVWRWITTDAEFLASRAADPAERAAVYAAELNTLLIAGGLQLSKGETLRQHTARLRQAGLPESVQTAAAAMERLLYTRHKPGRGDAAALALACRDVKKQLKAREKLRYIGRRIFCFKLPEWKIPSISLKKWWKKT